MAMGIVVEGIVECKPVAKALGIKFLTLQIQPPRLIR